MRPIIAGRFFKKKAPNGDGGGDDRRHVSTTAWDEVGTWRSSGGPCKIPSARRDCVSTFKNYRVRDMKEKSRSVKFDSSAVDDHEVDWRQHLGDCAIGVSRHRVEKSTNNIRTWQAEPSIDLCRDDLNSAFMEDHVRRSVAAFVDLADSRVNSLYTSDDRVSDVVGENSMQSSASFGVNAFKILDDRAAEVLRKSMQALEISSGLKIGSLMSAGPELQSRWAREQAYFAPPRRRELNDSSSDLNLATVIPDLNKFLRNRGEVLKTPDLPDRLAGAFSNKSVSPDMKLKPSEDHFVEFQKSDESSSGRPSSPNDCVEGQKHFGVHSNLINCSIDEDLKGRMSPPRICRWGRVSPRLLSVERVITKPQIPCNRKEDGKSSSLSQNCITHTSRPCNPEHTEEDDGDEYLIHRNFSETAKRWDEKAQCFGKQLESSRKVEMQDCDRPQVHADSELTSSSQGAIAASSGTHNVLHHYVVKSQNTLDSSVESERILEVCPLSASPRKCEKISNRRDHGAEVIEMQYRMLHEKEKPATRTPQLNVELEKSLHDDRGSSSSSDWTVEGVGCILPRPSTPWKNQRAKYSSATSVIEAGSEKASNLDTGPHSEPEILTSTARKYQPGRRSKEPFRSSRHSNKPLVSPRKTIPVILSSPRRGVLAARKGYHDCGRIGLKSEDNRVRKAQRTGKIDWEGICSWATQKVGTAVTLNISVTPFDRKEETNQTSSAGTNSSGKSAESKCTQTPTICTSEVVDNSMESKCRSVKSTQTVELSSQKKPLGVVRPEPSVQNKQSPSMETLQRFRNNLTSPQEEQIANSRSTWISDSGASPTVNSQGGCKLRHWPPVIPELDNWILEVVSGWLGTEYCPSQNGREDTSVAVSPSDFVVNTGNDKIRSTSFEESSPLHGPNTPPRFLVSDILNESLDRDIKRLAEFDSRIGRAHSVDDLFQILQGFSTIHPPSIVQRSAAKPVSPPVLAVHEFQKDEAVKTLLAHIKLKP